jgi:hypothetical protein
MPDLSLRLTYTPLVAPITTNDVSMLMQRLDGAYQAAGVAPRLGVGKSGELWALAARRQAPAAPVVEIRRLISEIEYLNRAARRENEGATRIAYEIATDGLLRELDRLRRSASVQREFPPMECLRLRMQSPLALLLGIPDAFVYVGGVTGVGALLALLEKQANVFGRIKLERDTLKLQQAQVAFEREQIEEQRQAWREALDATIEEDAADDDESGTMTVEAPFKLDNGVLDELRPGIRANELGE